MDAIPFPGNVLSSFSSSSLDLVRDLFVTADQWTDDQIFDSKEVFYLFDKDGVSSP
ncbi:hypothetical protein M6B38_321050 [Iris pallida]|uniref:Uncharacterized protein n=1 Tax=Iris pallida TaxID=29817 RepID=A0AAX6HBM4_IRIPA|nr:hypothetical protein M6B38_321050 [Iris pallida]